MIMNRKERIELYKQLESHEGRRALMKYSEFADVRGVVDMEKMLGNIINSYMHIQEKHLVCCIETRREIKAIADYINLLQKARNAAPF